MSTSRGICAACRVQVRARPSHHLSISARRNFTGATAFAQSHLTRSHYLQSPSSPLKSNIARASPAALFAFAAPRRHNSSASQFAHDLTPAVAPPENAPSSSTGDLLTSYSPDWVPAVPPPATELGFSQLYGLDFGWGPSTCVQWLFEHVHVWGALPWWGSIVATAAIVRFVMLPLLLKSSDTSAKLSVLAPKLQPLQQKMRAAMQAENRAEAMRARFEMSKLQKESGVSLVWSVAPILIQIPSGFALWRVSRRMAEVPIPGMDQGGLLWFADLTHADPLYILPMAAAYLQYQAAKRGVDMNPNNKMLTDPFMRKLFLYGLPGLGLVFIGFAPAAVQLNFVVTAAVALFTNYFVNNSLVRKMFGLAPIAPAAAPASAAKFTLNVSPDALHPEALRKAREDAARAGEEVAQAGPLSGRLRAMLNKAGNKIDGAIDNITPQSSKKLTMQQRRRLAREQEYEEKRKGTRGRG